MVSFRRRQPEGRAGNRSGMDSGCWPPPLRNRSIMPTSSATVTAALVEALASENQVVMIRLDEMPTMVPTMYCRSARPSGKLARSARSAQMPDADRG